VVIFEDCGHVPHREKPELVLQAVIGVHQSAELALPAPVKLDPHALGFGEDVRLFQPHPRGFNGGGA